ncbi:MAG: hypothetical protein ACHQYP_07885 [Nitrospiria bacterium]
MNADLYYSSVSEIPLFFASFLINFSWEMVQTPLYEDVFRKTYLQILISRLHCTLGDVQILLSAYWFVARFSNNRYWVMFFRLQHLLGFTPLGLGYTLFSEWVNIDIRSAWKYSPLMPRIPLIGTGLMPFLQWLVLPPVIAGTTRRFLPKWKHQE